jgi:transcription elongation factor GreA
VLTELLRHAKVGEAPESDGVVGSGSVVTARILGDESVFLLGSREIVGEDSDLDVYSEGSPLGAAIMGHRVGDTVTYTAPNGKEITVEIDRVEPYSA